MTTTNINKTLQLIVGPLTRWKTLEALGLTEKHVIMCLKCGMEWPTSKAGVESSVRHAKNRLKQKGHCLPYGQKEQR